MVYVGATAEEKTWSENEPSFGENSLENTEFMKNL